MTARKPKTAQTPDIDEDVAIEEIDEDIVEGDVPDIDDEDEAVPEAAKTVVLEFKRSDFKGTKYEHSAFVGKRFTLEYDRDAVIHLERTGFKVSDFIDGTDQPLKVLYPVFRGAFWKNHRNVSEETIDEIFLLLDDEQQGAVFEQLTAGIALTYQTLAKEDDAKGKVTLRLV